MKQLSKLLLFLILILFSAKNVTADNSFVTNARVTYDVLTQGETKVTYDVTITNKTSDIYPTSYALKLNNSSIKDIKAVEQGRELTVTQTNQNNELGLKINFEQYDAGKGKSKSFILTYTDPKIAQRTGEIWEIAIPKVDGLAFDNYDMYLLIPKELGEHAYISPSAKDVYENEGKMVYFFNKEKLNTSGITASFGRFQVFNVGLSYHLQNEGRTKTDEKIALPPDTNLQRVYLQNITPKPENVIVDQDGNWLAQFELAPKQRMNIKVDLTVQTFATPVKSRAVSPSLLLSYTQATTYWQKDDETIRKLAQELKTPQKIYDFVVATLKYDFNKVNTNPQRMGAMAALGSPDLSICTEFTDLFIAIARAAGIPAREINGYAYTENPEIQPLSLVSDVLHSWPQYWSEDRHAWISVDPTWESTSGINFFDHLDLRHIAFVIHGTDDSLPLAPGLYKVGDNPQKDVFVSFGQLSSSSDENPIITSHISKKIWPFVNTYTFRIENKSKTAVYDRTAAVYFDDKKVQTFSGIQIPPGGNFQKSVDINFGLWKKEIPGGVHTDVDGLFSDVTQTHKESYQLFQLILIFVLFILILINTILKGTRKKIVKTIFMKK